MHFLLDLFTEKFTRLLFLLFTQLIPILFFNCNVEEDGTVASAGISGQDEGFLDESATVDSPEPLEVLKQVPSETSATGKGTVKRRYHYSYLDMGFVETSDNKSHCVICGKVLPNISMFPAKMRRHFEGVHPDCKDKPSDFFRRKYGELTRAQKMISSHSKTVNEKALMASYLVTELLKLAKPIPSLKTLSSFA